MPSSSKPDVRVRLSAEGIKEVTDALKKITDEAYKQGKKSESAFSGLSKSLGGVRGLVSKLTATIGALSFAGLAKEALDYADAIGKAAQKTGATAEELSVLRLAASTADVENEELDKSLIKLAVNMEKLKDGTEDQIRAFATLGISQKELADKSTGQAFTEIANRLSKVGDSATKTAIAVELFGKSGASLIPLLNDVGDQGFDVLRKKAEELGLVVDTETALLAQNVNDSFTEIKGEVRGLALQFVSGLLPSVKQAMDGFKEETAGKGVKSMKDFGQEVGRVVRTIIAIFRLFGNTVGLVFKGIGDSIGNLIAAGVQASKGNFKEAINILNDDTGNVTFKQITEQFKKDFARVVKEASQEKVEVEVDVKKRSGGVVDVESAAEKTAREKAEKEQEQARKEAARLAEKEAKDREQANQKLADFQTKMLSSEGQRHEAFQNNLQQEINEINKLFDTLKASDKERQAFIERFKASQTAAFNLDELKKSFDQQMEALDQARERININAQAGLITQYAAEKQILELEAARIPQLKEINKELRGQAAAIGPEAAADVQKYTLALEQLQVTQKAATDVSTQFKNAAFDALDSGLANTLKNLKDFETVGDVVKSVFQDIAQSLADLAAEIIAKQATLALLKALGGSAGGFSQGGLVGYAEGGKVGGVGTGTSDSNLALLSKGEFVVRQAVVSQPGMLDFLQDLNGRTPRARAPVGMPRFADGGLNNPTAQGGAGKDKGIRVVNVLDPSLVTSALGSAAGEKTIMNVIQQNASGIRRLLTS